MIFVSTGWKKWTDMMETGLALKRKKELTEHVNSAISFFTDRLPKIINKSPKKDGEITDIDEKGIELAILGEHH